MPSPRRVSKPTRKSAPARRTPAGSHILPGILLGLLFAVALAAGAWLYLHRIPGHGRNLAGIAHGAAAPQTSISQLKLAAPLSANVGREHAFPVRSPFGTSEDVYEAGARLYAQPLASPAARKQSCASCHGSPSHPGAKNPAVIPPATHFFTPALHPASPSQIFVHTKYGVAGSPAMPAYQGTLTDRQIWQIALLLANANQPLPLPVTRLLDSRPRTSTP